MGFADFDIMGKCADIISKIGATGDTGGTTSAGTISAKLNALLTSWTSTRAGYIDNIRTYTTTNNTASKTGVLSAKLSYLISLLENTTYGLNAIKSGVNTASSNASAGIVDYEKKSSSTIKNYTYPSASSTSTAIYGHTTGGNTTYVTICDLSNIMIRPDNVTAVYDQLHIYNYTYASKDNSRYLANVRITINGVSQVCSPFARDLYIPVPAMKKIKSLKVEAAAASTDCYASTIYVGLVSTGYNQFSYIEW